MRKNFKNTVVTPLPVLIVGTYDENEVPNAMNVAWGGQCGDRYVAINIAPRRKTLDNIRANKAFTVSFADRDNLVQADYVGIDSGLKVPDKLARTGWAAVKSENVNAPIFEQLPLALECKLTAIEETSIGEIRIVGEVVNMSADERILDERGKIDLGKLNALVFDSASALYRIVGDAVGKAFHDGAALRK